MVDALACGARDSGFDFHPSPQTDPLRGQRNTMKRLLSLCVLALLSACNSKSPGADDYYFGKKQYEMSSVQVKIVTYPSSAALQKVAGDKYGVKAKENIAAFSVLRPPFDKCTIHMVDPAVSYQPEFVGHEFLHCVYGQWHTDNSSRS